METILVTGLDGSGKSTFFSGLRALNSENCSIVLVPHIDLDNLKSGTITYRTASFINALSERADHGKQPALKAVAMFASMLLFRELATANRTHFVFCERHPLIDTPIYASFYASRLLPGCVDENTLKELDNNFEDELNHCITLLPVSYQKTDSGKTAALLHFIYDWFHLRKKDSVEDLKELFGIGLPHRIYFLKAAPEILYERIRNRERLEAHESVEVLSKLDYAYERMFEAIRKSTKTKVIQINAASFAALTGFFETVKQFVSNPGDIGSQEYYPAVPGRGLVNPTATRMRLDYLQALGYETNKIAHHDLDLQQVQHNIESFIGSVEIPLGMVGPLLFRNSGHDEMVYTAGATLEGALIASMNRGAKAISLSGGFSSSVVHQRMVRAPLFILGSHKEAELFSDWTNRNTEGIRKEAQRHSNHAQLLDLTCIITGSAVHVKFAYQTGDASGQNMTTTCTWYAMLWMVDNFQKEHNIELKSFVIEGNAASDKKVSEYSRVSGRGINVVAECVVKEDVIRKILRTTSDAIVACYGPSTEMARIDGMTGYNINVANAIAAIFAATGQDLASVHESSVGILFVEKRSEGLYLRLTLPSLVIGTVGGGTHLPKQNEVLKMMDCAGGGKVNRFAQLIAGFALGLELSTYAAIVSGEFAKAHEKLGRNKPVKWLLLSDLKTSFLDKAIVYNRPPGALTEASIAEEELMDNGIITNLAGRTSKKLIGFIPFNITFSDQGKSQTRRLLLKSKALDIDVIKGLHVMAASVDPKLSDLIYEYREHLEYKNCHIKEIRMYDALQSFGFTGMPLYYGSVIDEKREAFLVLQERLVKTELHLFNSENSPELWTADIVRRAISEINKVHSHFARENSCKVLPEIVKFEPGIPRRLYEKMVAIMYSEAETEHEREHYRTIMRFPDELASLRISLPLTVVHNDFNPRNVAVRNDGSICIYDWELAMKNIPHRDVIEMLCFTLPAGFTQDEMDSYLDYHFEIAQHSAGRDDWRSGYRYSLMEYVLTRLMFYKVAGILIKLKFPDRVLNNAMQMLNYLQKK